MDNKISFIADAVWNDDLIAAYEAQIAQPIAEEVVVEPGNK